MNSFKLIIALFLILIHQVARAEECAVLLHGFFKNSSAMRHLEEDLTQSGYKVFNITYPTKLPIPVIIDDHIHPSLDYGHCNKVHFIGHSMGGLITRSYLAQYRPANLGNVILIASPSKGSEIADFFAEYKALRDIVGHAAFDLASNSSFLKNLPVPDYHAGVISANKPKVTLAMLFLNDDEHDGVVTVGSTKFDGMKDQITLFASHNLILSDPQLFYQVKFFLNNSKFDHQKQESYSSVGALSK